MDARAQLIRAERRLGKLAGRANKRSALLRARVRLRVRVRVRVRVRDQDRDRDWGRISYGDG